MMNCDTATTQAMHGRALRCGKYKSVNEYYKERFGRKIYKVSINAGFTCPNRDGKTDTRGCIFCSAGGSGEFAGSPYDSITAQIDKGILKVKKKAGEDAGYIAYFQAYTNTYASVDVLREKYIEAINHPEVVALSIATRPDCLGIEVVELLKEMNLCKPIFVELGLQTIKPESAEYIRRGYDLSVYDDAVTRLKNVGINVVTHVILGLPGETKADMINTVKHVVSVGSDGIKLQLLHVIHGTDLEKDYLAGRFETMTMEEYMDVLGECICAIPQSMVIHRLTGDGDKKTLVAPLWSADKKKVLNEIQKRFTTGDRL